MNTFEYFLTIAAGIFLGLIICFFTGVAHAQMEAPTDRLKTFKWQAPTENVDGSQMTEAELNARSYRLYLGTESGLYTEIIDIAQDFEVDAEGFSFKEIDLAFPADTTVYAVMTCYYPGGTVVAVEAESAYSNEAEVPAFIRAPVIIFSFAKPSEVWSEGQCISCS